MSDALQLVLDKVRKSSYVWAACFICVVIVQASVYWSTSTIFMSSQKEINANIAETVGELKIQTAELKAQSQAQSDRLHLIEEKLLGPTR